MLRRVYYKGLVTIRYSGLVTIRCSGLLTVKCSSLVTIRCSGLVTIRYSGLVTIWSVCYKECITREWFCVEINVNKFLCLEICVI